jgi:sensor histidine kinase regulating citrate/malate metabolism
LTANDGKLPPEEAESLMQDIRIYDSTVKTGNPALDVLLTEKSNKCQVKGISLTCSGDGSVLSFMRTMDIYSLFGNAVDNAIEAVDSLEEEKKYIDIAIEKRGDLVFLSFSNYFNGTLAPLAEGLPQTTKTDEIGYHGFGMKSMKQIAGRYDGDLSVTTRGEIFYLNIYLQIPKSADK